jgi:Holliday junction resolvasome RuvABC endonuclease subunit
VATLRAAIETHLLHEVPGMVVIEDGFSGGSGLTTRRLAAAQAAVLIACDRVGIVPVMLAPSQLKLWATGDGRADKNAMIAAARCRGYRGDHPDEADAWLLAAWGQTNMKR